MNTPILPIAHYQAILEPDSLPRFSDFPGSAWRGALGHSLKRTVCVTRADQCTQCLLYQSCVYPYFFDTPPAQDAAKMRRYNTAPHPFVLRPGQEGGKDYRLGFALFGQANRHLPVFVHALQQAAEQGRGVSGKRMRLLRIEQETAPGSDDWRQVFEAGGKIEPLPTVSPTIPPVPEGITIQIHSPLRVKREGRHVGARDFRFADLFCNLLRRVSMLMQFHAGTPLETDFRALTQAARAIEAHTRLHWRDHTRYSARQKAAMQMGGVVGDITVRDQDIAPFWPYLWLGQWTHAGSAATMGLGAYTLASLPAHTGVNAAVTMASRTFVET